MGTIDENGYYLKEDNMTQETELEKLIKSLRIKADMIRMGEGIAWGSETELMYQSADALEALQGQARASLGKGEVEYTQSKLNADMVGLDCRAAFEKQYLRKLWNYWWVSWDYSNPRCCPVPQSAKPVEVVDTELAALAVEAFNKAEKPENHIGLCAGYRIAQAILARYNVTKKESI